VTLHSKVLCMQPPTSARELSRRPVAFLPFVLAGAALAFLVGYVAVFGVDDRRGDEGTPARIFQLIMAAQLVAMTVFAVAWLPRAPRPALLVLIIQAAAAAIPIATILLLESR
jgi:hypothetical protein